MGTPWQLLARVIEAIRDCPEACVLVHYPRSGGEARVLLQVARRLSVTPQLHLIRGIGY